MAPVYGHVSDHVEIDDAYADLRVKDSSETIDNRGPVDQILFIIQESLQARGKGRYLLSLSLATNPPRRGICTVDGAQSYRVASSEFRVGESMSVSEKTRRALKEFGLTDYEAKVYVSLVESGTQTASELSKTASIPYSKIYEILGNLERKGWVETEQGRPSKYYPKAPSTALESSRSRQETTLKSSQSDAIEELQPLYAEKGVPDKT